MSEQPAHSPWGPSSLKQKINCLASDQATRGLPDTDSDASISGTATHMLVEQCREENVPAITYLGYTIDVKLSDGTFKEVLVDQDRVNSAQAFIDHINALPGIDFNEQRIHYSEYVPGAFGTLDGARGNDGTVYLRDFKDGKLLVYAEDNEQLLGCALGFLLDWGHLFDIKEFNLGIVQPRRDHVDIWVVPVGYVLDWANTVLAKAYVKAQQPDAPYTPGEWCTFCKIRGTCKARAAGVFEQAVGEFEDLDEAIDRSVAVKWSGTLTHDQVARLLPALPGIKKWCSDIEKYAFGQLRQGIPVGEYKIVEGSLGDREFLPDAELTLVKEAGEKAPLLYAPAKLLGPAKVEKVLGVKRFKPPTDTKPAGDLYHLIKRPPGQPQMVPGDDPRPPMVFDAANVFEDVEESFE